MNPISKLTQLGQSLWYDNIQRKLLESGELKAMIDRVPRLAVLEPVRRSR